MAVKIKLKRLGKVRSPQYRIIVADARTKRDGRAIEEIGKYQPKQNPSLIEVDSERAQYWLGVGAQPTEPVMAILKVTGDWQKFKGLPGAEGTLKTADEKADKQAVYEAALAEVHGESKKADATTPKKKAKKASAAKSEGGADEGAAEQKPAKKSAKKASPKAEAAKADAAKDDSTEAEVAKADAATEES